MTYLLAKYTLLFLLSAVLGFLLGYWFSRRNIEDVSESFEDLRKASRRSDDEHWNRLWGQLKEIPEPKETDLSNVYSRLDSVSKAVSQIPKPEPVNLQPLADRISRLENDIKAIPVPPKPQPVDLSPVTGKIEALQSALRSIPKPEPQRVVDLKPVQSEISTLRSEIRGLPKVETQAPVDLTPVNAHIKSLEQQLRSIPKPNVLDLKPVDQRLRSIETELGKLGKRLSKPATVASIPRKAPHRTKQSTTIGATQSITSRAPKRVSREEPRILKAALYGKKDNLKLISGVGPKLEKLLNKNGVYYFWQVAEWNKSDILVIDERLDSFKGRISRDNWVRQASRLRRDETAARMPTNL